MARKRKPKAKPKVAGTTSSRSAETIERWAQLASEAQARGATNEAITYYAKIVAKDPSRSSIWHALAGQHYANGSLDQAISAMQKVVSLQPLDLNVLNDLGGLYLAAGALEQARKTLQSVVESDQKFSQARYNLSSALYQLGRVSEAIVELKTLLRQAPNLADGHFNLGVALRDIGNYRAAIESFEKARKLSPDNERTYLEIARLHSDNHYLVEAIANYRGYLERADNDPQAVCELADVLQRNGATQEAIVTLQRFLDTAGRNQKVELRRAQLLHTAGRLDEAEQAYTGVLERFPETTSAAVGVSRIRQFVDPDDPVIAMLGAHLAKARNAGEAAAPIHFALGKVFDDLGDVDRAFSEYSAGNLICVANATYDREKCEHDVDAQIEVFTDSLFSEYRHLNSDSKKPVLVVGMPRSGTTLVEQIIASHPQAAGAGELAYFQTLAPNIPAFLASDMTYPLCWRKPNAKSAGEIASRYLELLERHDQSAVRITDKMPGNYMHIGLFRSLFREAKIIVCRREPRDVALSIYFQFFRDGHAYGWSLSDIAHCYVQYERLTKYWLATLPAFGIRELHYEELIGNAEAKMRELIAFLDLEWDSNCLQFHKTSRDIDTASNWQVRQPLYTTSLARWRRYEAYLGEFSDELTAQRARYNLAG